MGLSLKIFTQVSLSIITVTSCFLNFCLLRYILRRSKIHVKDKLTISLAVSDLMRSLFGYVMEISLRLNDHCNLVGATISFFSFTATNHLVLIMFDRWLIITKSALGRRYHSSDVAVHLSLAFCWLHAAVFAMMPFVGLGAYGLNSDGLRCSVSWRDRGFRHRFYHILLFFFYFFVPLLLMTTFFVSLRKTIRVSRVAAGDTFQIKTATSINTQRIKAERRCTWMFTTMSIVFAFAWLPYAIISFCCAFINATTFISSSLDTVAVIPAKASTIYSPVVIAAYNSDFRRLIRRTMALKKAASVTDVAVIPTVGSRCRKDNVQKPTSLG